MTHLLERWLPWKLFAVVVLVSVFGWWTLSDIQLGELTAFQLFPLFGLLAWSIMWTHYALGGVRLLRSFPKNKLYSRISAVLVLVFLLLHPGILAWKMWDVTGLLPPESFYAYVGPAMKATVIAGSISLVIFLAFDVFEYFHKKPWIQRQWKWISLSQMVAMTLIFIHALRLGGDLQSGWFQFWWILLGALLIPCFGLILRADWTKKPTANAKDI